MLIALVHPYPWDEVRRGGERYVGDLASHLVDAGHRVELVTSSRRPGTRTEGGVVIRGHRRLAAGRLAARNVTEVQTHALGALGSLLRRRYDIVHATTVWGAAAALVARQRVVYTELGHPTVEDVRRQPGGLGFYRAVVRRVDAVTALSVSAAAAIEEVTGRRPEVVPPGVRLDRFIPTGGSPVPETAAESSPDRPIVLFVSDATTWRKRVDLVLAAAAQLLEANPGLRVRLAGPGDHRWALERLGPEIGDVVRPALDVGVLDDDAALAAAYARATVTVLPSTHEAFGLVLVESLAAGTPVVCTDGWGMADVLAGADHDVARGVGPDDPVALAGAIEDLLGRVLADGAGDLARRCREHARRWDWSETVGPAHVACYRRVSGPAS